MNVRTTKRRQRQQEFLVYTNRVVYAAHEIAQHVAGLREFKPGDELVEKQTRLQKAQAICSIFMHHSIPVARGSHPGATTLARWTTAIRDSIEHFPPNDPSVDNDNHPWLLFAVSLILAWLDIASQWLDDLPLSTNALNRLLKTPPPMVK